MIAKRISVWLSFSVLLSLFCLVSISEASERFQPRGCEFSVEFPGKPKIYDIIIPPTGKIQNAEYIGGSGKASDSFVFVAEGMPVSKQEILRQYKNIESYLLHRVQLYAEANGIQSPEFKYFEDTLGNGVAMRGYKTIDGIPIIYSTMTFLGERSFITLRVGCAAQFFPPPGMTEFMKSVRKD